MFRANRERQRRQQAEEEDSNQAAPADTSAAQARHPEINELRAFLQEVRSLITDLYVKLMMEANKVHANVVINPLC